MCSPASSTASSRLVVYWCSPLTRFVGVAIGLDRRLYAMISNFWRLGKGVPCNSVRLFGVEKLNPTPKYDVEDDT